jgi:phosphoglycolate phosphatase-like HAD superfamily hydrolase
MPSDGVELADVAPAEAAQERAEGRRRLDREAEDPGRAARSESPGVVDAFTARERRHDEREQLVSDVRPARPLPEVEVGLNELAQAEMVSEGGGQE